MVHAVHYSIEGRARYKVEGLQRSLALKERIERKLPEHEGVMRVQANPLTGSVLVHYNAKGELHAIAESLEALVAEHLVESGVPSGVNGAGARGEARPSTRDGVIPRPGPFKALLRLGEGDRKEESSEAPQKPRKKPKLDPSRSEEQKTEPWCVIDADAVVSGFNSSSVHGLTSECALEHLRKFGPNILPESLPRSRVGMFVDQFMSLPVGLLTIAAGFSVATGGLLDAVVIMSVVTINAMIGYATESEAERTIESLKNLVKPYAHLVRDGKTMDAPAEEVVVGDVLVLKPGTYVTADSRLIEANHLTVDESALTGESMPVVKSAAALANPDTPLADRVNMVFMGTLVTGGQGLAVVVATGKFTEIGKLQLLVGEAVTPETPMEKQLRTMGNQLVFIGCAVCGVVFIIGMLRGMGFIEVFKTSISLAVAAVPEGLPTVATTTLALGVGAMKRHKVLMRRLDAVETLGAVQTICFDKTGTITLNRMSVIRLHTGMRRIDVNNGVFMDGEDRIDPASRTELKQLMHTAVLCSEADVEAAADGCTAVRGTPTETALIDIAIVCGMDVLHIRRSHPLIATNLRSENRLYMSTRHEIRGNSGILTALKGSPLDVLAMCRTYLKDGTPHPLTEEDRIAIQNENEHMAGKALRVLGLAYAIDHDDDDVIDVGEGTGEEPLEDGLIWLGLIGMADPVRDGVQDLIGVFHKAGIDTVMITGDQSPTAFAIGKALNLSKGQPLEIMDSTHLANLEPDVIRALAEKVHVFARVSPSHKLQIVQALQKAGRVVAMTGDGVNDGPALKAADIGIAMGGAGTDIAREVADVVLEDDNLETMIMAVSHGRTIYRNIRKAVHFFLATNMSEIMVTFAAIATGLGYPLNTMQLLWINLISDIFPGLALAMEPPEPDVLEQPPRDPSDPILKNSDLKRMAFESTVISAGSLAVYGYGLLRYGPGMRAGTLAFQGLTTAQLLHAYSCRSETIGMFDKEKLQPNPYLTAAMGGSLLLQATSLFIPGLRSLLGTAPIGLLDGAVIGAGAALPLIVNELTKNRSGREKQ
ncbi:MAG: HAD-IC family P-type ATPase [Syntrophobacteraceae bacterium]